MTARAGGHRMAWMLGEPVGRRARGQADEWTDGRAGGQAGGRAGVI